MKKTVLKKHVLNNIVQTIFRKPELVYKANANLACTSFRLDSSDGNFNLDEKLTEHSSIHKDAKIEPGTSKRKINKTVVPSEKNAHQIDFVVKKPKKVMPNYFVAVKITDQQVVLHLYANSS